MQLDDPSGNSYVEEISGLNKTKLSKKEYTRTKAQNEALGIYEDDTIKVLDMKPFQINLNFFEYIHIFVIIYIY